MRTHAAAPVLMQMTANAYESDPRELEASVGLHRADDVEEGEVGEVLVSLRLLGGVVTLDDAAAYARAILQQVALGPSQA